MIVGIDIGGTKTHLMGEDEHGRIRERTLATSDWRERREAERDASMLVSLVDSVIGDSAAAQPWSSVRMVATPMRSARPCKGDLPADFPAQCWS